MRQHVGKLQSGYALLPFAKYLSIVHHDYPNPLPIAIWHNYKREIERDFVKGILIDFDLALDPICNSGSKTIDLRYPTEEGIWPEMKQGYLGNG